MNEYMTIRQVAAKGYDTEFHMRALLRQGKLPGFYSGRAFKVNVPMFVERLNQESVRQSTAVKVKVIIEEGIVTSVLADGSVEVEIVDIDPDYEDYEALKKYEEELHSDPDLKEREYTVAHFEEGVAE